MGGFSAAALSQGGDCQVIPPKSPSNAMSSFPYFNPYRDGHRNISEFMEAPWCFALPLALPSFSSSGLGLGPSFLLHGDQCCESPQALGVGRIFGRSLQDLARWTLGNRSFQHDHIHTEYIWGKSADPDRIWLEAWTYTSNFWTATLDRGVSLHMGVSKNRVFSPKSSILIGVSIIFTIRFGVPPFLEHPYGPTVKWENRIGPLKIDR